VERTEKDVLSRETLLPTIDLHDVVNVGLEPLFRNLDVRDVAVHRRLCVDVGHLVPGPQLERLRATDATVG
jgi:hypothetical protein